MSEQQTLLQLTNAMSHIPAPIYQRVKQAIINQISSGQWQPHQRIPSESELVAELGVSRMTINRALRELTTEGFLVRMQGVGTFVAEIKTHAALLEIRNIADEISARGHRHYSKVLHLVAQPAKSEEAKALEIAIGDNLFYSQIVHYENDDPVQIEERWVNAQLVPDYLTQPFDIITPYTYLMQVAPLSAGEHLVEAVVATEQQHQLLNLHTAEPCLLIRRRTWSGNQVVSLAKLFYPGTRFQLFGRFTTSN